MYTTSVCLFVNRPPGSHLLSPDAPTRIFRVGMLCIWARWAGCPRRLPNKKLTKSYTRYPVVVLGGPVRRSL